MYNIVVNDVKTLTGTNVRKIFLESNLDPRFALKHQLMQQRIYQPSDTWSVPLLVSLLELKQKKWVVNFEMEEEVDTLKDEKVDFMIEAICTGQGKGDLAGCNNNGPHLQIYIPLLSYVMSVK